MGQGIFRFAGIGISVTVRSVRTISVASFNSQKFDRFIFHAISEDQFSSWHCPFLDCQFSVAVRNCPIPESFKFLEIVALDHRQETLRAIMN
jgi:hypothetical protein